MFCFWLDSFFSGFLFGIISNHIQSLFFITQIVTHPEKFALCFTFGNLVAICSTAFLYGPVAQLKAMFDKERVGATLLYFFAMGLTLFVAFQVQSVIWVLVTLVIQFLGMEVVLTYFKIAMAWYVASYIPYGIFSFFFILHIGREILKNMCCAIFKPA